MLEMLDLLVVGVEPSTSLSLQSLAPPTLTTRPPYDSRVFPVIDKVKLQAAVLMENNNPSSSKTDRKFVERNRRIQMKALYSNLNSLLPHQNSKEAISLPDQICEATNYIKKLQINLEKLKERKNNILQIERPNVMAVGLKSPQIEIQQLGSTIEVVLITGLGCQFVFKETIRVLQEEGSDIVNASYTVVEDAVFHTIHCQVAESANGVATRISEKLKKFLDHSSALQYANVRKNN